MIPCGIGLFLRDRLYRALGRAGAALDAGIGVDDVLAVAFRDRLYRALSRAGAARYTIIRDHISHSKFLLHKDIALDTAILLQEYSDYKFILLYIPFPEPQTGSPAGSAGSLRECFEP